DPRQFSAVGRGGMFAHLVDSYGAVELDQVHRFRHHWERQASLRLREGDPGVLVEYEQRGRLHGGTLDEMEVDVITAWQEARRRGDSVALMAHSTDTVTRLNRLAQHTRIRMGELDADAPSMRVGEKWLLLGDEVVTRRNDRTVRTDRGLMVKNRDHWTITTIHPDRSVTISGRTGTVRLPVEYVAEHLQLGYAQTSHATQGRTVDNALAVHLVDFGPKGGDGVLRHRAFGQCVHSCTVCGDDKNGVTALGCPSGYHVWCRCPATFGKHREQSFVFDLVKTAEQHRTALFAIPGDAPQFGEELTIPSVAAVDLHGDGLA
ncbi:MAG: AAA family ATPase, partial [Acidobacteria bacterium]|nr:AAA family ATPase [Acidobacteriota bacterium]